MQSHDRFVSVNGIRLHCLESGDAAAPPVLLLHGGSAHAHWWDGFAATIADTHRVLALDLRGHGDSDHTDPPRYGIADYVRDVVAVIEAHTVGRVALIGHSLGAMVAVAYAAVAPQQLSSLIVVDSQLKVTAAGARYMTRLRHFPQPLYRDREQAIRRFRLLPVRTEADTTLLAQIAAHGIRQLPDGRWTFKFDRAALALDAPQDLTPLLRQLRCPILFVRGTHSTLLSHSALMALQATVPHAEMVEIANAHHHVMLDNPAEFARAVGAFLRRAERRTQTTDHRL